MGSQLNIMQDDTLPGAEPIAPADIAKLRELAGYSINRRDAELWAQNDVKFLVYDDTSLLDNGFDSDDEDGMLEHALQMSQVPSDDDANVESSAHERVHSSSSKTDTHACFCQATAPFPKTFHPTKLKLFRPGKPSPAACNHYLAISYCWPEQSTDTNASAHTQEYQVRDLNGTVRSARAPSWVLQRAIDVAISCGIRMIWIDQECLPQPTEDSPQADKDEQQMGIQAMDIIYSRAALTAGLLSKAEVANQKQMDAIAAIQSWKVVSSIQGEGELVCKVEPQPDIDEPTMHLMMDVVQSIISDRWYTRAWVTQEALSAGNSLLLVLSQGQDIPKQANFSLTEFGQAESVMQKEWQSISRDIFVIPVDVLNQTLGLAQKLLPMSITPRADRPPTNIRTLHRAIPLINRAREMNRCITVAKGDSKDGDSQWLVGAADKAAGSRGVVDVASALGILSSRKCRDVQDRVAIVANMCNFHVRLNTSVLARHCKSLKLALLTLAIANGDYSLLVPETYAIEHELESKEQSGGWLWPFNNAWHRIDHTHTQYTGLVSPFMYSHQEAFSPNGIRLSAHLWEVKDKIDMTPIQLQWSDKWNELTRVQAHLTPKNIEGKSDFVRGYIHINEKTPKDDNFIEQIRRMANLHETPGEWPYRTNVSMPLLEHNTAQQKDLGDMIFDVIRYLYGISKEGNSEPSSYALSLANGIWHSVRTTVEPMAALPDFVGDWLYHHEGLVRNSYEMLDINATPDGNSAQLWFLERIMRDGFLWVGRYVAAPAPDNLNNHTAALPGTPVSTTRVSVTRRQIARNKLISMTRPLYSGNRQGVDERKRAALSEISYYQEWSDENEDRRSTSLASLLDVDGPCLVAVPFNGAWEILPRPTIRAMSICWVVEKWPSVGDGDGASLEKEEEVYHVVKKVKGLFECMYIPRGLYTFS